MQAEWIADTIKGLQEKGITRFEATPEEEEEWCKRTKQKWDESLFPLSKSWYQGSNIPGKKIEPLNW